MPARPHQVLDPGVQQERTALAWQRTGLSLAAAGVLYLHATVSRAWLLIPGAALLLVAAATLLTGWRRYERLHQQLQTGAPVAAPRPLATLATAVTLFSTCAILLAVLAS
jgi:uncharacterized membrane protein YidH (DUF202 family)